MHVHVVRPGPHLPSLLENPPRPPIPTPPALLRQEVFRHVLKSLRCQCCSDVFRSPVTLWRCKVNVEIPRHQQLRSPRSAPERFDDPLHRRRVVGGKVTSHNVPSPCPRRELKSDDIGPELPHRLQGEVWSRAVENCDAAAVSARRVRRNDAISGQPAGVDSISKFGFL